MASLAVEQYHTRLRCPGRAADLPLRALVLVYGCLQLPTAVEWRHAAGSGALLSRAALSPPIRSADGGRRDPVDRERGLPGWFGTSPRPRYYAARVHRLRPDLRLGALSLPDVRSGAGRAWHGDRANER